MPNEREAMKSYWKLISFGHDTEALFDDLLFLVLESLLGVHKQLVVPESPPLVQALQFSLIPAEVRAVERSFHDSSLTQ